MKPQITPETVPLPSSDFKALRLLLQENRELKQKLTEIDVDMARGLEVENTDLKKKIRTLEAECETLKNEIEEAKIAIEELTEEVINAKRPSV